MICKWYFSAYARSCILELASLCLEPVWLGTVSRLCLSWPRRTQRAAFAEWGIDFFLGLFLQNFLELCHLIF
jgi:hypothetical protein